MLNDALRPAQAAIRTDLGAIFVSMELSRRACPIASLARRRGNGGYAGDHAVAHSRSRRYATGVALRHRRWGDSSAPTGARIMGESVGRTALCPEDERNASMYGGCPIRYAAKSARRLRSSRRLARVLSG